MEPNGLRAHENLLLIRGGRRLVWWWHFVAIARSRMISSSGVPVGVSPMESFKRKGMILCGTSRRSTTFWLEHEPQGVDDL
jgi:hypothetical protein